MKSFIYSAPLKGLRNQRMSQSKNKILVIGLGEIGYNNARYMTEFGLDVDGYDINAIATTKAFNDKVIKNIADNFSDYDYYVICVSTHNPRDQSIPSLNALNQVIDKLKHEAKIGALVGVDSTIPTGTTEMITEILHHRVHVVHVPHRYYNKEKDIHGVNQLRVIGGCKICCINLGKYFYEEILRIPLHTVSSSQIAELCKVTESAYRYIQIAFAEELKIVCDKAGLDFNELRNAINTKWNVQILEARDGINQHCIPKDGIMFKEFCLKYTKPQIITAAQFIDQMYRRHISPEIERRV